MSNENIPPLKVFAPGSLIGASADLASGFMSAFPGVPAPEFQFAMTGKLAADLLAGADADVALFANRFYAEQVYQAGRLDRPRTLAGNRLALLVRPEMTGEIAGLMSLAKPGIRVIAFPPDMDPCGAYTAELFARDGLAGTMAAKGEIGEFTILGAGTQMNMQEGFTNGAIDVAVVYASLGSIFPGASVIVPLPPEHDMHE
ncbi:MAG: molybdate ABC transporter substrate-binding protein, partial [Thermomicrobiales bacterium]